MADGSTKPEMKRQKGDENSSVNCEVVGRNVGGSMTVKELRSILHVLSPNHVYGYEVVQLLLH